MNSFDAAGLCSVVEQMSGLATVMTASNLTANSMHKTMADALGGQSHGFSLAVPSDISKIALRLLGQGKTICTAVGFTDAVQKLEFVESRLRREGVEQNFSSLSVELEHAKEAILEELKKRSFLYVEPERTGCLDNYNLLGESPASAFPSAIPDILGAGNCLAADCNTAAVLHLMRVVEWGLRALCVNLGMKRVKSKVRKSGRITYGPISTRNGRNC